ncbi:MAG: phosphosulfolactate synthase [Methanobacteriaceae archaeon]
MKSFNFLLPKREEKPRTTGMTMVLDKGLGFESAKSLMELAGDHVDFLKFGWGTIVVHEKDIVAKKIEMYKSFDIKPYPGGTLFELAYTNNMLEDYFIEAKNLGFEMLEISDGSTTISKDDKLTCIKEAKKRGFEVVSEVGKKDPVLDSEISIDERITDMEEELKAGSTKVIVEAREGGKSIGIFDENGLAKNEEIDYILNNFNGEKLLWEAPNKEQQVYFILKVGNGVNLGNISTEDITSLETLRRGLRGDTIGKV